MAIMGEKAAADPARASTAAARRATMVEVWGCAAHANKEYLGPKAFGQDDEMCIKVQSKTIPMNSAFAEKFLQEIISLKAKGIDGAYSGNA